ncbi:MAG: DotU family type VI secretion system protein [Rhodocyclaceae bacterium]|nr:DotU family type VI secretion system protein [Rhodocyclaceae bacterium]MBX3668208.1 DotU family type VI secretion system protein [Rhodocyclaceae bacterium]
MSSLPPGPNDPDATMRVPTPGRRGAAGGAVQPPATAARIDPGVPLDLSTLPAMNTLVRCANPMLALVPRIRGTVRHPNPAALRDTLLRQLAAFEQKAKESGVAAESVLVGKYALCTLVDEAVSCTPWGGTAQWAKMSLLVSVFREGYGGEKFFQLLNKMAEDPQRNIDLLELFYVCIALGFEGRFGVVDNGRDQLEKLRDRLVEIIRKVRGEFERDLSPHWKGETVAIRRMSSFVPLWVTAVLACLLLLGVYVLLVFNLSGRADGIAYAAVRAPAVPPPPPRVEPAPPPKPVEIPPRLSKFLRDEIAAGKVVVRDEETASLVSIQGDGLFDSGSSTVKAEYVPILKRIADALNQVPGPVLVSGHTDDQPIRTVRFPSNWHLSQERATNVVRIMLQVLREPERIRAEGLGETEPLVPNDNKENRARNRRVEIVLRVEPS